MKRQAHFLRRNENNETIHHAIFYDTETDPDALQPGLIGHRLRFGWAAYVRRIGGGRWSQPDWLRFEDIPTFWSWVESKHKQRTRLYAFCHNTAFDLPVLGAFNRLPIDGWKASQLVIDAPPTIIKLRKGNRTLMLLDTLNWWRMPLAKLGDSLGLPKLDMPPADAPQSSWDAYGKRDVEIILKAVTTWADFLTSNDFGGFATTLAAQALRTYRHRFMHHKVLIDGHEGALDCARSCYHGGRTEPFYIGRKTGQFTLLDINSMYPYVMRAENFPTRLVGYRRHIDANEVFNLLGNHCLCVRATIETDEPAISIVRDGKLVFPVGSFDAALTTPELRWLRRHGRVLSIHDAAIYERAPIFRDFVDELYTMRQSARQAGNDVMAWLIKILMNSLYGKFGQRGLTWEIDEQTTDLSPRSWIHVDAATGQSTDYRQVMGVIQRREKLAESRDSHPAIAAHVTAYGRMMLWQLIMTAGRRNVYYTDTDSLLVNRAGRLRLRGSIHDKRLGGLKIEGRFSDIEIHGPKDYCFDDRCKVKGVKFGALWLGPNEVEQEQWSGLRGLMRGGDLTRPTTATVRKRLARIYNKGEVGGDGWVEPFVLG